MREEFEKWWKKADEDIDTAKENFKIRRYSYAAFLCQQAVEKALKSLDVKVSKKVIRTHDLTFLANRVEAPDDIIKKCTKISPVYTDTRYPDFEDFDTYNYDNVKELIIYTEEILVWVKRKLGI